MNFKTRNLSIIGLTALFSMASVGLNTTVKANEIESLKNADNYQIAQINDYNCREVGVSTLLNVRRQPNGAIVGVLEDQDRVAIVGEPNNGWVRINTPITGYVYAGYLNYCNQNQALYSPPNWNQGWEQRNQQWDQNQQNRPTMLPQGEGERITTVDGSNCRRILTSDVPVRTVPQGNIIGTLEQNENVYIANEGYNGWVPIELPVSGYVKSANLGYCAGTNL